MKPKTILILGVSAALIGTVLVGLRLDSLQPIWPPLLALILAISTRRIVFSLLAGSLVGSIFAASGSTFTFLIDDLIQPVFTSSWNGTVVLFTLLCGGFAALIQQSGGLDSLAQKLTGETRDPRRLEFSAFILGLICFFDGLANSLIVGRTLRPAAKKMGISSEKLAYIADSTSAPVACLALATTWVAFQLGVIEQGLDALADHSIPLTSEGVLIASIGSNFYCWAALLLVPLSIHYRWGNLATKPTHHQPPEETGFDSEQKQEGGLIWRALVPIATFVFSLFLGLLVDGVRKSPQGTPLYEAFGFADSALVLLISVGLASLTAAFVLPSASRSGAFKAWGLGCRSMLYPIFILVCAWMMGAVISELGTAQVIAQFLNGEIGAHWLPALVFLISALIAYATGTSWGTMALAIPIAIPLGTHLGAEAGLIPLMVAASLSGAVFGDHTSPFSDTTIISAAAAGCDPWDHVRTQFPYALCAAAAATLFGFIPAGFGVPNWICLPLCLAALWSLLKLWPRKS
ncbi:MAG: Na+/H+ antiporter NhaC family protein [Verrucomicrobiota bacterium]